MIKHTKISGKKLATGPWPSLGIEPQDLTAKVKGLVSIPSCGDQFFFPSYFHLTIILLVLLSLLTYHCLLLLFLLLL